MAVGQIDPAVYEEQNVAALRPRLVRYPEPRPLQTTPIWGAGAWDWTGSMAKGVYAPPSFMENFDTLPERVEGLIRYSDESDLRQKIVQLAESFMDSWHTMDSTPVWMVLKGWEEAMVPEDSRRVQRQWIPGRAKLADRTPARLAREREKVRARRGVSKEEAEIYYREIAPECHDER